MTTTMPKYTAHDHVRHSYRTAQVALRFSVPAGDTWRYLIRYTDGRHRQDPQAHPVRVVDEREIDDAS